MGALRADNSLLGMWVIGTHMLQAMMSASNRIRRLETAMSAFERTIHDLTDTVRVVGYTVSEATATWRRELDELEARRARVSPDPDAFTIGDDIGDPTVRWTRADDGEAGVPEGEGDRSEESSEDEEDEEEEEEEEEKGEEREVDRDVRMGSSD